MDLWLVQVKYGSPTTILHRNSFMEKSVSSNFSKMGSLLLEAGRAGEIRFSKQRCSSCAGNSFVVKAMGKKNSGNSSSSSGNGDRSIPEGDGGNKGHNPPEGSKSNEGISPKPHHMTSDWREFRATLFAREQVEIADSSTSNHDGAQRDSKPLGLKWAHPISLPESGSVLVATEKLDGDCTFERTVVLLLRSGNRNPREGPFGVVINRPLHKKIKHIKPNNLDLATTFADCTLHFGGPIEASMFLLRTSPTREKSKLAGFEEVIPGLSFGYMNSLVEATGLVKKGLLKPQDFRFYDGYAGWNLDQLRKEIESNYWHVAACSANLIFGATSESSKDLWEEILQLMGGQYSELSRKPKQDI